MNTLPSFVVIGIRISPYWDEKDIRDGKFRYYWFTDLPDRADFEYYVLGIHEEFQVRGWNQAASSVCSVLYI